MGVILGPHGIKGEVKVKSFTAHADAIADYGPLSDARGSREFVLKLAGKGKSGGDGKGVIIARIAGVEDRNAAEALKGQQLFVSRDRLPEIESEDEFYLADLIGLRAVDGSGAELGRVASVENYGASDVLAVESEMMGAFDVPFTKAFVPVVDLAKGEVVLSLPQDYFETPERSGEAEEEDEQG